LAELTPVVKLKSRPRASCARLWNRTKQGFDEVERYYDRQDTRR